jgi:hypothetical protein
VLAIISIARHTNVAADMSIQPSAFSPFPTVGRRRHVDIWTVTDPPGLSLDTVDAHHKPGAARRDSVLPPCGYEWTALTDVTKEIRICSIEAGPADSELRVALRTIDLDENANQYSCLSYVWGSKDKTSGILLDGHDHLIHRSLHFQLLRLRANGVTQPLWCDAICINQADLREQGTQVGMMGRIFSGADKVFLGVDEEGLDILSQPANEWASTLQADLEDLSKDAHLDSLGCFTSGSIGQAKGLPSDIIAASQFRRIINSSFFSRCWTVQEVVLAKEAVILGNWGVIPWSLVVKALGRYNHHREHCCASFVDALDKDMRSGCYKVSDPVLGMSRS